MRKLFATAALLALSGCATTRYVSVPCLTKDQLAERKSAEPPHVSDKLSGKADEDVKVIAGSAIRLRSWGEGNLAILEGCTGS
jgi:hypothetical protein